MLVSILSNLVMTPGVIPPTPTPHGGGENIDFGLHQGMGLKKEDEYLKRRKKILDQDEEDWALFIHNFIISQNLN
jgi:hypothetical protein